jgi:hypothetical protein
MNTKETIHIVASQWGTAYNEQDANNLFAMICRNTSFPICFHLFSNEPLPDLNPKILKHPEPALNVPKEHSRRNYRKTVGLCDNALAGLTGKRIFIFDLDVLIVGNLDELFTYPQGEQFYIIKDWKQRDGTVGQGTCFSFVVGTFGFVKEKFEADPMAVISKYGSATQQFLSMMLIQKFGKLTFWPESWFQSFRYHCLPSPLLRRFLTPVRPKCGTKVLAFHGHPDIRDAIQGQWSKPGTGKEAKGLKKLYKACKATPWIEEYWHSN